MQGTNTNEQYDQSVDQFVELLATVGQNNHGAYRACFELAGHLGPLAVVDLEAMRDQGITGTEAWLLYKDACQRNIDQMHAALMQNEAVKLLQGVRDSKFYQPTEEAI